MVRSANQRRRADAPATMPTNDAAPAMQANATAAVLQGCGRTPAPTAASAAAMYVTAVVLLIDTVRRV